jgi:putative transposase
MGTVLLGRGLDVEGGAAKLQPEFKLKAVERLEAGESGTALSRELAVKRVILYRWRDAFRTGGALALRPKRGRPPKAEALALERARGPAAKARHLAEARRQIAALERKVGQQQVELDFFKQALRHIETSSQPSERPGATVSTPSSGARAQQQGELSVERMCALADLSRAGYYRHLQASAPRVEETLVRDRVQRLALENRHYGHRRIAALLSRAGVAVNKKRVLRLMREDNLLCLRKRAFVRPTTVSRHGWRIWPNLAWRLQPMAPNQLWVADITYVRLAEEFAYLAVLLDAFSRRVVGWAMASHVQASLALAALEMALSSRVLSPAGGLIHHSDRGVQYACGDYIARLAAHGIQPSMSRIGCPYDNAMAESFMKTLKTEEVDGRAYRDLIAAKGAIGGFIEQVYNRQRLHSALAYRSPMEFEADQPGSGAAAQQPLIPAATNCP